MSENDWALLLFVSGWVLLGIFAILNFGLERIWFPRPHHMMARNMRPVPPLVGAARRGHMVMGSIEGICFCVGIFMIVMACAIMGTRGYGSF